MVNATHMIVLMVPQGAALEVDRVAEVCQADGADVIETRAVPVPVTLFDRRTVHNLLVSSADTGYFYTAKKNPRTKPEKLELKKFDPIARKHVVFKEQKMK